MNDRERYNQLLLAYEDLIFAIRVLRDAKGPLIDSQREELRKNLIHAQAKIGTILDDSVSDDKQ